MKTPSRVTEHLYTVFVPRKPAAGTNAALDPMAGVPPEWVWMESTTILPALNSRTLILFSYRQDLSAWIRLANRQITNYVGGGVADVGAHSEAVAGQGDAVGSVDRV